MEAEFNGNQAVEMVDDPLEEVRRRRLLINRLDNWLFEEIEPYLGQRILEAGCGHGNLTQHLLDRELVIATDIEPSSVEIVRVKFQGNDNVLPFVHNICDPVTEDLKKLSIDTVVSLNVFEHIEDDEKAFANVAELLIPGGRMVLIVPAHQWLYGTMDSPIGHFRRYSKQDVAQKMEGAGLKIEKQFYLNVLGTLGWFLNGRLFKQTVPPTGQLKWFNSLIPSIIWLEKRVRPPFGLSVVSIAKLE